MTEDEVVMAPEPGETGPLDQTYFAEEVAVLPNHAPSSPSIAKKPGPKKILIGIGAVFGLLIVTVLFLSRGNGPMMVQVTPTPTASGSAQVQSELDKRFAQLDTAIQLADPGATELAFPPLDFALNLQDATTRQQQRRR